MKIKCVSLELLSAEGEPLRGLADFEIPDLGMRLRNCVVSESAVIQWIDLPASRGRTRTAYLFEFTDEAKQAEFNEAALDAVEVCRRSKVKRPDKPSRPGSGLASA